MLFGEISLSYIEYGAGVQQCTSKTLWILEYVFSKRIFIEIHFPIMFDYYYYYICFNIRILFYKLYIILCAFCGQFSLCFKTLNIHMWLYKIFFLFFIYVIWHWIALHINYKLYWLCCQFCCQFYFLSN